MSKVVRRFRLIALPNVGQCLKHLSCLAVTAAIAATSMASSAHANPKYAGFVIDANTGKTLYSSSADSRRYPASLTKMMTLYMVFDALERGKIRKSTRIRVSRHAASQPPSKFHLKAGSTISVEAAIYALVTKSANDVAAAVGEHLGGTESGFAVKMTRKARALGMSRTTFKNASGLPNSRQLTTARDMAKLGIALREHFPQYYGYFKTRNYRYGKTSYRNHNRLLGTVSGVDGIKTGYTRASGFNLVSSVRKDGRSIVAVVMGGKTSKSRNAQMVKLINRTLPKASKRRRGPLLARRSGGRAVKVASAASLPTRNIPVPSKNPKATISVAHNEVVVAALAPRSKPVDQVTTASIERSGWAIQVASMPTESEARQYLKRVQQRSGSTLANASPFIEQFTKGSTVYHRARFAGFDSKSRARNACKALKRSKISCYAIPF